MRGSSALLGAVDAELECIKVSSDQSPDRIGKLTVTKQKDGEDGLLFGYKMEAVALSDIDPALSSLAVQPLDEDGLEGAGIVLKTGKGKRAPKPSLHAARAFEILKDSLSESGQFGVVPDLSRSVKVVRKAVWREKFVSECSLERGSALKAFNRANQTLWENRTVSASGEFVWISVGYDDSDK
jgi:hypothetical protein